MPVNPGGGRHKRTYTDEMIREALIQTRGNIAGAVRILKCSRSTVARYLKRCPEDGIDWIQALQREGERDAHRILGMAMKKAIEDPANYLGHGIRAAAYYLRHRCGWYPAQDPTREQEKPPSWKPEGLNLPAPKRLEDWTPDEDEAN